MQILITGACGFVGSTLAKGLVLAGHQVTGIDNLIRPGSQLNVAPLKAIGVTLLHGDIRNPSDLETLPKVDWVLDCAANASVLAGIDGKTSSRQLVEHNLGGTINLLEYCRQHQAGFLLLSTSHVYSIPPLAELKMKVEIDGTKNRYTPDLNNQEPTTKHQEPRTNNQEPITKNGVAESFSTQAPVSLYGATKLASEQLALDYGHAYDFPVWINRCGVMAGAGQFGHPAQGIVAFWIHSFREGRPLKYIGFDGLGHQVRDCLHPRDLLPLLEKQFKTKNQAPGTKNQAPGTNNQKPGTKNQEPETRNQEQAAPPAILNISGGLVNSMSLAELTAWCQKRFPGSKTECASNPDPRAYDIPWMVLDNQKAAGVWDWKPAINIETVCEEIAEFAEQNPDWIHFSRA